MMFTQYSTYFIWYKEISSDDGHPQITTSYISEKKKPNELTSFISNVVNMVMT